MNPFLVFGPKINNNNYLDMKVSVVDDGIWFF